MTLAWHAGTHAWEVHDGYPRHAHSVNGVLTIDPHSTQPMFAWSQPAAGNPAARAEALAEARHISERIDLLHDELAGAAARRAELIAVLAYEHRMSARVIGEELGITGTRVTQILNMLRYGKKTRGLLPERFPVAGRKR